MGRREKALHVTVMCSVVLSRLPVVAGDVLGVGAFTQGACLLGWDHTGRALLSVSGTMSACPLGMDVLSVLWLPREVAEGPLSSVSCLLTWLAASSGGLCCVCYAAFQRVRLLGKSLVSLERSEEHLSP